MKKRKLIIGFCIVILIIIILEVSIELIKYKKNKINNNLTKENEISDYDKKIDEIYNNEATKGFADIRELAKEYSLDDARKDNCFVKTTMVYNDHLYKDFMIKYNKKESAFIRVVQATVEGDIILTDILYNAKQNKISLVKDDTRDEFSAREDRIIWTSDYEKIGKWKYQGSEFWVVYNGELPENYSEENYDINPKEMYIIATIN